MSSKTKHCDFGAAVDSEGGVNVRGAGYWSTRLVVCRQHRQLHCWLQDDGQHVSRYACRCAVEEPYLCPIDAHRIPWVLAHPDFAV